MSKIAIISQPDQGVLIDVSGCSSMQEAIEHLSSTLQVSSQFWRGSNVALNLGKLELAPPQVAQVLAIAKGVGANPQQVFAVNENTRAALEAYNVRLGIGAPMSLPTVTFTDTVAHDYIEEERDLPAPAITEEDTTHFYETQDSQDFGNSLAETTASLDWLEDGTSTDKPAAATAPPLPAVLYLRQTLRSGQTVSHKGHLVIIGDVNPGAEILAEGDISIWGALRGIAHAGIGGNLNAEIRALQMQPIQIRIAHAIARSPDRPRHKFATQKGAGPETARLVDGKIRVSRSNIL